MFKNILILLLLSTFLYSDEISTLIEKIKNTDNSQKRILINQLKLKLKNSNQKIRLNIMKQMKNHNNHQFKNNYNSNISAINNQKHKNKGKK